jgi:hypothetical protein
MIDLTKLEWIEINLPYDLNNHYGNEEGFPESPNLDDREKEVFGISLAEAEKNVQQDLEEFSKLLDELRSLQEEGRRQANLNGISYTDYILSPDYALIEQNFWEKHQNDPCVIARDAFKDLQEKIFAWSDEQPEWKAHAESIKQYNALQDLKSFCGRNLDQPGTIIELENGQMELIGSINRSAGICGDCKAFDEDSIVKRYAVALPFIRRKANDERSNDSE